MSMSMLKLLLLLLLIIIIQIAVTRIAASAAGLPQEEEVPHRAQPARQVQLFV